MNASEKIDVIVAAIEELNREYGEYSVRRAVSRWKREASMKKWRTEAAEKRALTSYWWPKVREVLKSK